MSSAETSWLSLDRVLCAMDFSPSSFVVLPSAASIARQYGGELFLAHVVRAADFIFSVPSTSHVAVDLALTQASVKERLAGMLKRLSDIPHEVHLDYGSVPRNNPCSKAKPSRAGPLSIVSSPWVRFFSKRSVFFKNSSNVM
jgi:hypothetical protein